MKGMILAAGFGTRFRPATYLTPKPMVPLCNRPLIGYAIDALQGAGISEMVINLHHLPEPLEAWAAEAYPSLRLHFSHEEEILGTGGGIRKVRSILESEPAFCLVNGDTLQLPHFEALEQMRVSTGAVASLALRHPPPGDRFTKVFLDGGRITGFGSGTGEPLMFSGAHAIGREIFELLPDRPFSGITEDVYIPLLERGGILSGAVDDGIWFDIGTPLRYVAASDELRRRIMDGRSPAPAGNDIDSERSNLIAAGGRASERTRNSVLGPMASIAPSAAAEHSVLWAGATLDEESSVRASIIGDGVHLRKNSTVINAMVCRRLRTIDYGDGMVAAGDLVATAIDPALPTVFEPR